MATLRLEIPDSILDAAKSQASAGGHASVEAYVTAVLEAEVAATDEELESLLVGRLDDPRPSIEATPQLWQELRGRVRAEVDRSKKAAS